jgi:hypothetical protein
MTTLEVSTKVYERRSPSILADQSSAETASEDRQGSYVDMRSNRVGASVRL